MVPFKILWDNCALVPVTDPSLDVDGTRRPEASWGPVQRLAGSSEENLMGPNGNMMGLLPKDNGPQPIS